jgi:hypothetical protein
MKKIDRTGEVSHNVDGLEMKIIEYKNNKEVKVLFTASGQVRNTSYVRFKHGKVFPRFRRGAEEAITTDCEECRFNAVITALGVALLLMIGGAIYGIVELIKYLIE